MNPAKTQSPAERYVTENWLTPRRFAMLLGLLMVATFLGILLGLRTFIIRDYGMFSYPAAYFQRECFWQGELPFWNPFNHFGLPFLAQWNTLALYPPALIYLLLPGSPILGRIGHVLPGSGLDGASTCRRSGGDYFLVQRVELELPDVAEPHRHI